VVLLDEVRFGVPDERVVMTSRTLRSVSHLLAEHLDYLHRVP
jgi:hypothetical protein